MTVEEAIAKWCPFAVVGNTFNRMQKNPMEESCPCIADKCMAWRWTKNVEGQGYCGLAGEE